MASRRDIVGRHGAIVTEMIRDPQAGKMFLRDVMGDRAVREFVKINKALRDCSPNPRSGAVMTHNIPIPTWTAWRQEYLAKAANSMSWDEFRARKLNSGDFDAFRCGRIKKVRIQNG